MGEVVALHARYYAHHWAFGAFFEAKVASELGRFVAEKTDQDLFLNAFTGEELVGSITIDQSVTGDGGAHLRWFIVAEKAQGTGLGGTLMARAMEFCDTRGVPLVWLTTFEGLGPARRLYERYGFNLVREEHADRWQGGVREQRFERRKT